jgi:hypothetical protein
MGMGMAKAWSRFAPFPVLAALSYAWVAGGEELVAGEPMLAFLSIAFCFAHITCRLILAHVCHMHYSHVQPV